MEGGESDLSTYHLIATAPTHITLGGSAFGGKHLELAAEWLYDNREGSRDLHSGQRLRCARLPSPLALAGAATLALHVPPPAPPAANFVTLGVHAPSPLHPVPYLSLAFVGSASGAVPSLVRLAVVEEAFARGLRERAAPHPCSPALHLPAEHSPPAAWASAFAALPPLPACDGGSSSSSSSSEQALAARHARLRQWGLVHLPPEAASAAAAAAAGQVLAMAGALGTVQETNYGRLFDVRAEAAPTNLAFTPLPLDLHTDNPYRTPVPGFQALHCLEQARLGGETLFSSGWACAGALAREDPQALALLLATPLTFRYADARAQLCATRCVLSGAGGASVAYNARSQVALAVGEASWRSAAQCRAVYAALARFEGLCSEERHVVRVRLAPGEAVVWDNERVLHGRAAFEGPRYLQGCYLSRDSVLSAAAVALDREG